jgi:hypothetical protein|tara:strand:- start:1131 stop:1319 length:189 start_codon:yes stop_codon:yes gene_type:complete
MRKKNGSKKMGVMKKKPMGMRGGTKKKGMRNGKMPKMGVMKKKGMRGGSSKMKKNGVTKKRK